MLLRVSAFSDNYTVDFSTDVLKLFQTIERHLFKNIESGYLKFII